MSHTEESVSSVDESTADSGEVTIMAQSGDMKESAQASVNEKRTVKLTNKGLEWQIDINSKEFNSLVGVLRTLIQKTEPRLSSSKDIEALKAHINALEINLKALSETCDRLRGLLILAEQEDEVQQVNQTYESVAKETGNMLSKGDKRVREIDNEEFETATNYSEITRSSRRSKSLNSSRRSEAAAEAAALRAKLKYIDLEAKTRAELEKLETMRQIDMAEAKVGVLEVYDEEKAFSLRDIDNALPESSSKDIVGKYIDT